MGFDRSQLKTTTNAALDKQKKEQEKKRPKGGYNNSYHSIDDGVNRFRLMPFHPDPTVAEEDQRYAEAKCTSFIEVNKPKKDDQGNVIEGQMEFKKFPIFNARVHGDLTMDPIEEYMKFAKEIAIPNFTDNKDEVKNVWSHITGFKDSKGKYHSGLKPTDSWVVYALKLVDGEWKLGQLEIKKTVKEQLTELALEITKGQNPDPYTDPEDGYVIKITKTGANLDTRYKVSIDDEMINKVESRKIILPLTDDQLDEWFKLPSLHKMFVRSYKRADMEAQVEGLARFDAQLAEKGMAINVFGYDDWFDIIDKIDAELTVSEGKAPKEEPIEEKKPAPTVSKPKVETPVEKPAIARPARRTTVTPTPAVESKPTQVEQQATQTVEESPKPAGRDRLAELRAKHGAKK